MRKYFVMAGHTDECVSSQIENLYFEVIIRQIQTTRDLSANENPESYNGPMTSVTVCYCII
jgi:hypothetical protein